MPNRADVAQIEFAGFGNQEQPLRARLILRDQANLSGKSVSIKTKWPAALSLDCGGYGIDALVVVAPGDDEDRHVFILGVIARARRRSRLKSETPNRAPAFPTHRPD